MKKMNFKFAVIACTALLMGFASCSKDNGVDQIEGEKATLRISLEGTADTKALDLGTTITVSDAYAFILNGSNVIMDKFQLNAPAGAETNPHVIERETTTAASKVIVLGNVGNIASLLTAVNTLAELQAIVANYGTYVTGAKVWTKGEAGIIFSSLTTPGNEPLAEVTVTVYPISTKLNITIVNEMTNWDAAVATTVPTIGDVTTEPKIAINSVAVLYSGAYIHYTDNATTGHVPALTAIPASPATYYYSGISTWPTMVATQTSVNANLVKTWANSASTALTGSATPGDDFAETFYAFANTIDAAAFIPGTTVYDKHPIITVYGRFNGADWFWPAHFTKDASYKSIFDQNMLGGKFYNIEIELTGDANSGGGGDPDPESRKGFVTIRVTSAGWGTVINLPTITIN